MKNNEELVTRIKHLEEQLKELTANAIPKRNPFTVSVPESGLSDDQVKKILALKR